jgi:hypothetical protein
VMPTQIWLMRLSKSRLSGQYHNAAAKGCLAWPYNQQSSRLRGRVMLAAD